MFGRGQPAGDVLWHPNVMPAHADSHRALLGQRTPTEVCRLGPLRVGSHLLQQPGDAGVAMLNTSPALARLLHPLWVLCPHPAPFPLLPSTRACGQRPDLNLLLAPTSTSRCQPRAGCPELLAGSPGSPCSVFAAGSVTSTPASAGSSSSWRGESTRAGTPGAAATPTTSSA